VKIPFVALGINDGWVSPTLQFKSLDVQVARALQFDPVLQYKSYIDYALTNPYRALITSSQAAAYLGAYNKGCLPALNTCIKTSKDSDCQHADDTCINEIQNPILQGADFDINDIRAPANDPFPPGTYKTYLHTLTIQKAIGAQVDYQECSSLAGQKFVRTGDGTPASYFSSRLFVSLALYGRCAFVLVYAQHGDTERCSGAHLGR
jgi:hypothetical protein